MNSQTILVRLLLVIPMVLSLSVHEWAHAFSAWKLGDDTAEREGRLTLNPIVHIDPLGTLLLPLLGIPFGWAKPVPVNPARFGRKVSMRTGMAITAAAGPASNFVLALLCSIAFGLMLRFGQNLGRQADAIYTLLGYSIQLNISLGLFNLLPIPPLDGSRIASRYFEHRFPAFWENVERYSRFLLIGVFLLANVILAKPRAALFGWMVSIISHVAGIGGGG